MAKKVFKQYKSPKALKESRVHLLQSPDYKKRVEFIEWYFKTRTLNHKRIIFTDEPYFYLTKTLNKPNNRFWSQEQPLDSIEKPLNDKKIFSFFCDFRRHSL